MLPRMPSQNHIPSLDVGVLFVLQRGTNELTICRAKHRKTCPGRLSPHIIIFVLLRPPQLKQILHMVLTPPSTNIIYRRPLFLVTSSVLREYLCINKYIQSAKASPEASPEPSTRNGQQLPVTITLTILLYLPCAIKASKDTRRGCREVQSPANLRTRIMQTILKPTLHTITLLLKPDGVTRPPGNLL
jgi:hypothetical protein